MLLSASPIKHGAIHKDLKEASVSVRRRLDVFGHGITRTDRIRVFPCYSVSKIAFSLNSSILRVKGVFGLLSPPQKLPTTSDFRPPTSDFRPCCQAVCKRQAGTRRRYLRANLLRRTRTTGKPTGKFQAILAGSTVSSGVSGSGNRPVFQGRLRAVFCLLQPGRKSEVGSRRSEVGSRRSEVGGHNLGSCVS
jgi:hypothetical protein